MKNYFKDKVAIVTGSSRGIGRSTAHLLGSLGASVVLNARDEENLKRTGKQFEDQVLKVLCVSGDISHPDDCRKIIDATLQHYGRIDILIHNAAVSMRGPIAALSDSMLNTVYAINTVGPVRLSIMAMPH